MEASVFMKDLPYWRDGAGGMRCDPGRVCHPAWEVRMNPYLGETYSFLSLSRAARGKAGT